MEEFELPCVSVTSLQSQEYKIVLRMSYLDSAYDNDVMENRVVLNLLYAQMVADIERGWILVAKGAVAAQITAGEGLQEGVPAAGPDTAALWLLVIQCLCG